MSLHPEPIGPADDSSMYEDKWRQAVRAKALELSIAAFSTGSQPVSHNGEPISSVITVAEGFLRYIETGATDE